MPEVTPEHRIAGPVTFSLLLHVGLLALVARAAFAPQPEARLAEPPPNIRVSLVLRPAPPRPADSVQESQTAEEPVPVVEEPTVAEVSTGAATEVPLAEFTPDTAEADALPAITPGTMRAAVGTYVNNRRSTQTATWVTDCIIEQRQHGIRDCDRLQAPQDQLSTSTRAGRNVIATAYAGVTRVERHARLTAELEQEKVVMEDLMDEPGLLGQMAADRYYLDIQYVQYLNGNPSPYGPGNQFNCKGLGPCVYEYTGFVVTRPEAVVDENEFRVVPSIFGSRQ